MPRGGLVRTTPGRSSSQPRESRTNNEDFVIDVLCGNRRENAKVAFSSPIEARVSRQWVTLFRERAAAMEGSCSTRPITGHVNANAMSTFGRRGKLLRLDKSHVSAGISLLCGYPPAEVHVLKDAKIRLMVTLDCSKLWRQMCSSAAGTVETPIVHI